MWLCWKVLMPLSVLNILVTGFDDVLELIMELKEFKNRNITKII